MQVCWSLPHPQHGSNHTSTRGWFGMFLIILLIQGKACLANLDQFNNNHLVVPCAWCVDMTKLPMLLITSVSFAWMAYVTGWTFLCIPTIWIVRLVLFHNVWRESLTLATLLSNNWQQERVVDCPLDVSNNWRHSSWCLVDDILLRVVQRNLARSCKPTFQLIDEVLSHVACMACLHSNYPNIDSWCCIPMKLLIDTRITWTK